MSPQSIEALRHSQDILGRLLLIFTAFIGLGVVLESLDAVSDLLCAIFEWLKDSSFFDRTAVNKTAIGGLLVICGLMGEAVVEFWQPIIEGGIRTETDKTTTEVRLRADAAEEDLWKIKMPRSAIFKQKAFVEYLAGKPQGTGSVWYQPNSSEAKFLAEAITRGLRDGNPGDPDHPGVKWNGVTDAKSLDTSPTLMRIAGSIDGVTVVYGSDVPRVELISRTPKTIIGRLLQALTVGGLGGQMRVGLKDPTLRTGEFRIIVGAKILY